MAEIIIRKQMIKNLYHFTKVNNLESILKEGLLSIKELEDLGIEYNRNNAFRLPEHLDRISVSIGFPNYMNFHSSRFNSKGNWCIIQLKNTVLTEKDCIYYLKGEYNDSEITSHESLVKDSAELGKLFYEPNPSRNERGLLPEYTTNPTSEVLVKDRIELKYFKAIYFNDRKVYDKYKVKTRDIDMVYDDKYFKKRVDWQYWRQKA